MTQSTAPTPFVAIACGGTGGHLFPGLAVAEQLVKRGCTVSLLVSPKEVDQQSVKSAKGMEIVTLPAVALQRGSRLAFVRGFWQSWRASRKLFKSRTPHAALAMGGFTSAPPILAARTLGARTFLHESNTIPGRANRWLARFVDQAFVGFPQAAERLRARDTAVTGTPVRAEFYQSYLNVAGTADFLLPLPARNERGEGRGEGQANKTASSPQPSPPSAGGEGEEMPSLQPRDAVACRAALGLDANRPVVLVTGGSQGASGINEMILSALPLIAKRAPHWQWLHLTGPNDADKVKQAYAALGLKAVVHPFLAEMDLALGAASAAVSRAGASSLAELAAMRLPSLLVPYPAAADNHQFHNARAFEETGAAKLLEQKNATPEKIADTLLELVENVAARETMQAALGRWHAPKAAEEIAQIILKSVAERVSKSSKHQAPSSRETPSSNNQTAIRAARFGAWMLVLLWSLVLGIWSF